MIEALTGLGYERDELLSSKIISNKEIELIKQVVSFDQLDALVLKNKLENK
ncbi:MAG: hypothetical protein U9R39_00825 [Campylobacterota bacterium]|nr:hypothetical protein [Campylobacterota bacterium]